MGMDHMSGEGTVTIKNPDSYILRLQIACAVPIQTNVCKFTKALSSFQRRLQISQQKPSRVFGR
jgi:hypothetical protein